MGLCCPHHLLQRLFSLPVPLNCFSCNRTQAHEVLNISDEESGISNIMWLQSVFRSSWNNIWWGFNRLLLWHLNVIHWPKAPFISFVFRLYMTGKRTGKTLNQWVFLFLFLSILISHLLGFFLFGWLGVFCLLVWFGFYFKFFHQRKNTGIISHSYFVLVIIILPHSFVFQYEQHENMNSDQLLFLL